jgi:hypothetical protein
MWHAWGRRGIHSLFWWGNLTKKDKLEDIIADGSILRNRLRDMNWTNLDQDMDR